MPSAIPILSSIASLAETSQAWIVDIWGVMHNGARAHALAGEACRHFRAAGKPLDHGQHAAQLLAAIHRQGAGPRGLAADVQQVGAFIHHPQRGGDRRLGIEHPAAVGERIGGDVDDTHDERALAERQRRSAREPKGEASSRHKNTQADLKVRLYGRKPAVPSSTAGLL